MTILSPTVNVTPSIAVSVSPEIVNVAPTPAVPLSYVTVPPDITANVAVDPTTAGA